MTITNTLFQKFFLLMLLSVFCSSESPKNIVPFTIDGYSALADGTSKKIMVTLLYTP